MALLATLVGVAVRAAITPVLGNRIPFLTFFPAVTVASWYGGFWPGVLCTVLSTGIAVFLLEPEPLLIAHPFGDLVALGIFVAAGLTIAVLNETLHRERARLELARAEADRAATAAEWARDEAAAASRAKDEFLSILGHELRTPLTSVLGWARLLRSGRAAPATVARALDRIERNAMAQAQLIDDLLDVNGIITGKLRLDRRRIDPVAVVEAALDVVRPAAEAKRITVTLAPDGSACTVCADPDRLQQMTWNLLSNAVKFTPPGGQVTVGVERRGGELRIRVSDTGQGITPEFLPHVFERFTQADASYTRTHGGLGLGLAIVKHLVDLHGGTVAVQSPGSGKGATFTICLPIDGVEGTSATEAGDRSELPDRAPDSEGPPRLGTSVR